MAGKGCQVKYTTMSIRLCLIYLNIVCIIRYILILLVIITIIGINNLTYNGPIDYLMSMENDKKIKHHHLKKAGLFNPNPERVKDPLFLEHTNFFDPCDNLQIRYETLRSHLMESDSVLIPAKPATDSGSKWPLIGAKRRWRIIVSLCGRNESRESGVSAWIPLAVPAGKRYG